MFLLRITQDNKLKSALDIIGDSKDSNPKMVEIN